MQQGAAAGRPHPRRLRSRAAWASRGGGSREPGMREGGQQGAAAPPARRCCGYALCAAQRPQKCCAAGACGCVGARWVPVSGRGCLCQGRGGACARTLTQHCTVVVHHALIACIVSSFFPPAWLAASLTSITCCRPHLIPLASRVPAAAARSPTCATASAWQESGPSTSDCRAAE